MIYLEKVINWLLNNIYYLKNMLKTLLKMEMFIYQEYNNELLLDKMNKLLYNKDDEVKRGLQRR